MRIERRAAPAPGNPSGSRVRVGSDDSEAEGLARGRPGGRGVKFKLDHGGPSGQLSHGSRRRFFPELNDSDSLNRPARLGIGPPDVERIGPPDSDRPMSSDTVTGGPAPLRPAGRESESLA